jgi:hypothetical protein
LREEDFSSMGLYARRNFSSKCRQKEDAKPNVEFLRDALRLKKQLYSNYAVTSSCKRLEDVDDMEKPTCFGMGTMLSWLSEQFTK